MRDKELTKKLLRGPLCTDCIQKRVSWALSARGDARYCAQFEEEPTYDVQCTCKYFVKLEPGSITNILFDIVRSVHPSTIAGTPAQESKIFEHIGKIYSEAMAEDITSVQPIKYPNDKKETNDKTP